MNKFRSTILGGAANTPPTPLIATKSGGKAESQRLASVEITRDAGRSTDHRDEDRHRLARETAIIDYKGDRLDVDLINLSGGGAMIEAGITVRLWDRIDLYLGDGSPIECAVRWLRKNRIGLEFAHETHIECTADQRDALLLDVIRRSFPDLVATVPPTKPDLKPGPEPKPGAETAAELGVEDTSRRGNIRHPLIWNGQILWQHDVHTVRLRNISTSGALIDTQVGFPQGVELLLDLGASGQYFATVGWSRGGQAGLRFHSAFDLSMLAAVKPEVAPQRWDRPTYLNLSSSQASPWASEWDRKQLSELASNLEGFLKR